MRIREVLGRGSGQESPGFKRLLAAPAEVYPHFESLLLKHKVALLDIYRHPAKHPDLFQVAEGLLDFDLLLQEWRNRHILLVYRTIGIGTPSLKGKHSELLERGLRQQFFPKLWEVRDDLYGEWSAAHPSGAGYALTGTITPDPEPPAGPLPTRAPKPPRRKSK
jgi:tryptophan 2,3-dioxygenase